MSPAAQIRVYRSEESLESRRAVLARDAKLDAKSRQAILDFIDHLSAQGLTAHRQNFYLSTLRKLATLIGPAFTHPDRKDVERALAKIEKADYEYLTKVNYRTSLK